jgi:DinB superfamily/Pentapeptide repeats (8 copies)
MAAEYTHTDAFRGATFTDADLTGATFRECDLTQVKIVGSQVADLRVSGFGGATGAVVVDDVDVTAFVAAELDERHPERVQLRAMRTADDYRAMWDTVEALWSDTVARAERLSETAHHERVDDEWSFVETLRHLVFAVDVWVGRMLLDEVAPYHRLGLPPTDYPDTGAKELGIDLDARPSYAEVVALHADRRDQMRRVVDAVGDTELEQVRTAAPAPAWGVESHSVGGCLRVVMREHCEHRRFAMRDLTALEAR